MPSLETERGVSIHWEEMGRGHPVVLVHGWAMSSRAFAAQREALSRSHRLVVLDLRGHGRSAVAAPGAGFGVEDHARDLTRLLAHLDLAGTALVGWSMGGQVALEALPGIAGRLAALVLLSATPRFTASDDWPHGHAEAAVGALAARVERQPERALRRFFEGMFTPGELDAAGQAALRAQVLEGGPCPSPEALRGGLRSLRLSDHRHRLAAVGVPSLVVHGERDPVCSPGAAAFTAQRLGARLELLPGAGHAPQLSCPARVNELLAGFLAELP